MWLHRLYKASQSPTQLMMGSESESDNYTESDISELADYLLKSPISSIDNILMEYGADLNQARSGITPDMAAIAINDNNNEHSLCGEVVINYFDELDNPSSNDLEFLKNIRQKMIDRGGPTTRIDIVWRTLNEVGKSCLICTFIINLGVDSKYNQHIFTSIS